MLLAILKTCLPLSVLMAKMTMKQARAMRDGTLKGDSAIARAWKELISGEAAPAMADSPSSPGSPDNDAEHQLASLKARQEAW